MANEEWIEFTARWSPWRYGTTYLRALPSRRVIGSVRRYRDGLPSQQIVYYTAHHGGRRDRRKFKSEDAARRAVVRMICGKPRGTLTECDL